MGEAHARVDGDVLILGDLLVQLRRPYCALLLSADALYNGACAAGDGGEGGFEDVI